MTDNEWIDLGRRAMACKGWRWMPGMLARGSRGLRASSEERDGLVWVERWGGRFEPVGAWVPDLRDPATVGCLLALVRDALGKPHAHLVYDDNHWSHPWALWHFGGWSHEPTEAAALVAALEAANGA
jgi:hypothetical protein